MGKGPRALQRNLRTRPAVFSAREANRRYFRHAYRTGEHGWAVEEPSPYAVDFLRRLSSVTPGGVVLDVGCGEGRHAIAAARLGFRVIGIDYEPLALRRARRFAKANRIKEIAFRVADVLDLPFPNASYDVVLDYGCLHHQKKTDWPRYRGSILRVLKPRGYYVLSVFSPRFRLFQGATRSWHIAYGAYRRCFAQEEIRKQFAADFTIIKMIEEKRGGFWHVLMQRRCG
ncbi:MAG TPA: class I SAM-dependent methyltransferase [Candidatus Hydrogenedentes bacterium]|nr:class I SAM-dependent methyltransferase [Candidatus Hydrogenedentota bacterium]